MQKSETSNDPEIRKIRWGILSTAKIGREKVIPGIQNSPNCSVVAIASRNPETANITARLLNIEKAMDHMMKY